MSFGLIKGEIMWNPLDIGKLASDIIGRFKADPTKKIELEQELEKVNLEIKAKTEDHIAEEIKGRVDIIKAEMAQGDAFTKRARPTIIYAGLFFTFWNYVLPSILIYFGQPTPHPIQLPNEFWDAWKVVVSVWSVGRTLEKVGVNNKVTNLITGSK